MANETPVNSFVNSTYPELVNFSILNELYGNKEGREDERVFHFMPRSATKSHQINVVGLAQAIIGFTRNFSDESAEVVTTEKRRQYYLNPEPNFFMILTMSVPRKDTNATGGHSVTQYDHGKVPDRVYGSVLKQAYKAFKFFHGKFQNILDESGEDKLRAQLNFFTSYFERLDFASCDVLTIFEGIKFLPIDKDTYLRVQSFAGSLEHELFTEIGFSGVEVSSFFMYLDFLIWSSLNQTDTQVLYEHMVKKVIPESLKNELLVTDSVPTYTGQFVHPSYGPEGEEFGDIGSGIDQFHNVPHAVSGDAESVRTVYLGSGDSFSATGGKESKLRANWLVIYRSKNMWVCLLIDKASKPELKLDFFRRVHGFLGPGLSSLSDDVVISLDRHKMTQNTGGNGGPQMHPHLVCYIYFNRMNLATRAQNADRSNSANRLASSHELMLQLCDLHNDLNNQPMHSSRDPNKQSEFIERLAKNNQGYWLYGRISHQREVYMVINNKEKALKDVYETMASILETEFGNLFYAV
ncbi:vacuolar fusion protein CCZ1 homolog [Symsagittifera roscoffensis]|uniref:vacuolar fusion protein CCZ1 homolog n=1 Tax=Symsagittifera roscoffensis TaxID=84072 RepID=UPI00307C78B6